jgi:signal transduction histidine kinase
VLAKPEAARRALQAVQETGREAVAELHRVLRLLRDAPGPPTATVVSLPKLRQPPVRLPASPSVDVAIGLAYLAAGEALLLSTPSYGGSRLPGVLLVALSSAALAMRRRSAAGALLVTTGAVATEQLIDFPLGVGDSPPALWLAPAVAAFTVGVRCPPQRAAAALIVAAVLAAGLESIRTDQGIAWWLFAYTLLFGVLVLSGHAVRRHREHAQMLRLLTTRLRKEQEALTRLAIVEERTRMARDLHDAIAHGVSVMVLQAGAAEHMLERSPARAAEAVGAVHATGQTVLAELARLLGLFDDGEASPRAPEPTLTRLDELLARVRTAGLPVVLRTNNRSPDLPAGVDASAYRIIQEALTNTLKHAGSVPTEVSVRYEPAAVSIEVRSEAAPGPAQRGGQGGHGLVGMRERVEVYGGELDAGPEPGGGYAIRARLPTASVPS